MLKDRGMSSVQCFCVSEKHSKQGVSDKIKLKLLQIKTYLIKHI